MGDNLGPKGFRALPGADELLGRELTNAAFVTWPEFTSASSLDVDQTKACPLSAANGHGHG
jgi:hypothetical protein